MNGISYAKLEEAVGWRFSKHAREAMVARNFHKVDVLLALVEPELITSGEDRKPGVMLYRRDDITVVANPHDRVVITVLLRSQLVWDDADARERKS